METPFSENAASRTLGVRQPPGRRRGDSGGSFSLDPPMSVVF